MISFGFKVICSQGQGIIICIELCLFGVDLMLNLMINHRLTDIIYNG
jgi:hypothetical protein